MPKSALGGSDPRVPNRVRVGAKSGARLHQHGSQRELTFALMHMMDMARALLEHKRAADPDY